MTEFENCKTILSDCLREIYEKPDVYGGPLQLETALRIIVGVLCESDGKRDQFRDLLRQFAGDEYDRYNSLTFLSWRSFEYPKRATGDKGLMIEQDKIALGFVFETFKKIIESLELPVPDPGTAIVEFYRSATAAQSPCDDRPGTSP